MRDTMHQIRFQPGADPKVVVVVQSRKVDDDDTRYKVRTWDGQEVWLNRTASAKLANGDYAI